MIVLGLTLSFGILTLLGSAGQVFSGMPLDLGWSAVFSCETEDMGFVEESTEMMCPFHYIMSGAT